MEIFHSSTWVVMYRCESWTIKKAEWCRIDAFELWCWRRHLRDPWTTRRPNQSILKEINPKYSLEGLTLKLKLQYFGHVMLRADSLEKTQWENWGQEKGWQSIIYLVASSTQWIWVWANPRRWSRPGEPGVLQSTGSQRVRYDWATQWQQTWTESLDNIRPVYPRAASLVWEIRPWAQE